MQPLIFFGSDEFSLPVLRALVEAGWPVAAVVTKADRPAGRGRAVISPPIKQFADQNHIPVLQPEKLRDVNDELTTFGVQSGVVASFGKIIPDSTLEIFTGGLINIHPSLLPKYRGPSPIEAAILNGDKATGVTLMKLESQMDAGPIYVQERVPLKGSETQVTLYQQLAGIGAQLLLKHLPDTISGKLEPTAQDDAQATYVQLIKKEDGQVDWTKSAKDIEQQIRAYSIWPGSRTELFGREVIITAAHVAQPDEPTAKLLTHESADGTLVIDRLKPAGKREMTG